MIYLEQPAIQLTLGFTEFHKSNCMLSLKSACALHASSGELLVYNFLVIYRLAKYMREKGVEFRLSVYGTIKASFFLDLSSARIMRPPLSACNQICREWSLLPQPMWDPLPWSHSQLFSARWLKVCFAFFSNGEFILDLPLGFYWETSFKFQRFDF